MFNIRARGIFWGGGQYPVSFSLSLCLSVCLCVSLSPPVDAGFQCRERLVLSAAYHHGPLGGMKLAGNLRPGFIAFRWI